MLSQALVPYSASRIVPCQPGRNLEIGTVAAHLRNVTELLGWLSSAILLFTIGRQVHKQWRTQTTEGVSRWLFVGQLAASAGFAVYSWLLDNWVFVFTNVLMVVNAMIGYGIFLRNRRRERHRQRA